MTWIVEQYTIIGGHQYVLPWLYDEADSAKQAALSNNIHSDEYIYSAREATETEVAQIGSLIDAGKRHERWLKAPSGGEVKR